MAALAKIPSFSSKSWENRESEEDETHTGTVLDVFQGKMAETIVLQQLIIISRLLCQPAVRAELGAHFEKVHFQLSKEFELDHMTGQLLIYPSCVLHIVESSREVLLCVLKDLKKLQQHPNRAMVEESKVLFLLHNPHGRLFQQWSYKVIAAGQKVPGLEEEENTESLVCMVLSALQELETSKRVPESWEFIISQDLVLKLLGQDDLLSLEDHLHLYDSPLNIRMDFGQAVRSQSINRV
ncbi:testis-expressed protein 47 isoform X1 [Takifugu rubripes]|uniref:testis-expressed protein 47 isoform X1 n=1 Tax=Takifugu rubripes TaxID=31033 RepID=UPI001145B12F|nr:testis-expressed protein 47 isoform X1 [Takifugu rubripes]